MRVLHGPVNVGNQPWVLSRAEREIGLKSDVVVSFETWLGYKSDHVLCDEPLARRKIDKLRRIAWGFSAPLRYDVLHYYFGQSYVYRPGVAEAKVSFSDLRFAKRMGRPVFMTLQGCDVRGAAVSNATHAVTMCKTDGCKAYPVCVSQLDEVRKLMADEILPLCDRSFVLNPDLALHAKGAAFLPYASTDIRTIRQLEHPRREKPLVLHAPSDPHIKGTAIIEQALEELRSRFDFDYRVVKNLPHAEALKLYADADLVIDQALAGWYGGFAVEVMAMGKPVAAYIRDTDLPAVPPELAADLPILRIDPRTMRDDLAAIFERRREWPEIGRRSRAFVEAWHDPVKIARALRELYRDPSRPFDLAAQAA